jgi:transcriptional regulator with GAF, ATPase, and Fis domain
LNIHSELALPLVSGNRSLGALLLYSEKQSTIDNEEDITIFQSIADCLATALENAKLFHQTQSDLQEIASLHRLYLAQAWKDLTVDSGNCTKNYINRSKDSRAESLPGRNFPYPCEVNKLVRSQFELNDWN